MYREYEKIKKTDNLKGRCGNMRGTAMEILLLGAIIVGLPIIIIGCVAAWRERQSDKM